MDLFSFFFNSNIWWAFVFFYNFFYFWWIFIFTSWFPQCRSRLIILSRNYWVAVGFIEVFFF